MATHLFESYQRVLIRCCIIITHHIIISAPALQSISSTARSGMGRASQHAISIIASFRTAPEASHKSLQKVCVCLVYVYSRGVCGAQNKQEANNLCHQISEKKEEKQRLVEEGARWADGEMRYAKCSNVLDDGA